MNRRRPYRLNSLLGTLHHLIFLKNNCNGNINQHNNNNNYYYYNNNNSNNNNNNGNNIIIRLK